MQSRKWNLGKPVDTIALSRRGRAVVKYVAKMGITNTANNFLTGHENDGQVQFRLHIVSNRLIVRRPSSSTIKFGRWSINAYNNGMTSKTSEIGYYLRRKLRKRWNILTRIKECHNRCNGKVQGFWCSNILWTYNSSLSAKLLK